MWKKLFWQKARKTRKKKYFSRAAVSAKNFVARAEGAEAAEKEMYFFCAFCDFCEKCFLFNNYLQFL
jgi:hypothetical protein